MLADVDPWARLFLECIQKDSVSSTRITEILGVTDVSTLLQPLAVLAAERSQVDVLRYCIERGASLDDPIFSRAVVIHGTTSAMLEILWDLDWSNIQTNQTELSNLLYYAWQGESSDMLHLLLEHGAVVSKDLVRVRAGLGTTAEKFSVFIREAGIDAFKDSGALQFYAARGRTHLVEVLLNAGIDVNEQPTLRDIRELSPFNALYEATYYQRADTVQPLLDRGADVHLRSCEYRMMDNGDLLIATPWEIAQLRDSGGPILGMYKAKMAADKEEL